MKIHLRDYQLESINKIRESLRTNKSVLFVLPTGGGKTVIFSYIAEQAFNKEKRVLILVHRNNLLSQASRKLIDYNIPHGRIAAGKSRTKDLIQVASVQTLVRRLDQIEKPDLIIVDEGHHLTKNTMWGKVIEYFSDSKLLGVTATPIRLDGKGLGIKSGGYYQDMIIGKSISDLIVEGYLSAPITYRPSKKIDLKNVKIIAGDYNKSQLADAVEKSAIVGDAIQHYKKIADKKPAIVFCISVHHSKTVAQNFCDAGYKFVSIDGSMHRNEIEKTIQDLSEGKIDGITSCDLISEGTDVPVVEVGIFLRPTKSTALDLQQKGRILRSYPGKKNAILLDHVGNCFVHGLPEMDREWNLNGAVKNKKSKSNPDELSVIQCNSCYAVYDKKLHESCPSCGEKREIKTREIETVDGELEQAKPDETISKKREIFLAKTYEDFLAIAKKRGYNVGWAKHMHRWKSGLSKK